MIEYDLAIGFLFFVVSYLLVRGWYLSAKIKAMEKIIEGYLFRIEDLPANVQFKVPEGNTMWD